MVSKVPSASDTLLIPSAAMSDYVTKRLGNLNRGPKTGKR